MNWDQIEGNWRQLSGKAKERWGKFTNDQITQIGGQSDQLVGKIQQAYGTGVDETQRQVQDWVSTLDGNGREDDTMGGGGYRSDFMRIYGHPSDSAANNARRWANEARHGMERGAAAMSTSVQERPIAALAVAAGIGVVLGALLIRRGEQTRTQLQ